MARRSRAIASAPRKPKPPRMPKVDPLIEYADKSTKQLLDELIAELRLVKVLDGVWLRGWIIGATLNMRGWRKGTEAMREKRGA